MKYTLKDLKQGKVILMNSSQGKSKKILKKVFGFTMKSYELPGSMYYHADVDDSDGFIGFSIIERDAPNLIHLPIQKSEKFKI